MNIANSRSRRGPHLLAALSAAVLMTAGCRTEIDRAPDPLILPPAYLGPIGDGPVNRANGNWWSQFADPLMEQLIQEGLASSLDLRAAEQRLRQAGAVAVFAGAGLYPELGISASGRTEWDENGRRATGFRPSIGGRWQLDLSGARAREAEAERYRFLAQQEKLDLARLNLSVDIGIAYLDLATQLQLEQLLEAQEAYARDLLDVVASRFRQGVASRLDVLQQEDLVAEIHAQIPSIQLERNRATLALDLLTGKPPGSAREIGIPDRLLDLPPRPAIGAPLELLSRRPDLRALRNELIAADADAARALAERWPRLVFATDLFWQEGTSVSGGLFSLAAELFQPIYDGGRRLAEVDRTEALKQERRLLFSNLYLQAIAQVEDLAYTEDRLSDLLRRLKGRQQLLEEAESQAVSRYEQGFTDYLPVITARQDLLTIQQRLVRERRNLIAARLNLHRVLGGPMPQP